MNLTMIGRLAPCFLFSYAVKPFQVRKFVPPGLELITHSDRAFLNIVVCRVDGMRPRFAPRPAGLTYWHVAYRIHVRSTLEDGRAIEGLYFLRSDVDQPLLSKVANWLTDFRLHRARIRFSKQGVESFVEVQGTQKGLADASVRVRPVMSDKLDAGSSFVSFAERERVLKYAPLSMAVCPSGRQVRLAEVFREEAAWSEEPVEVEQADWAYPRSLGLEDLRLVRATRVRPIDYRWCLGRRERIRQDTG